MGVDGRGDADVGVAEEFLDDDEFDALFQEQGGGRVPEVVEADAAEVGFAKERGEGTGEVGRVDRTALRRGEHVAVLTPGGTCRLTLALLLFVVLLQRMEAARRESNTTLGGPRLGGQRDESARAGALQSSTDGSGTGVEVEVFPVEAEEFALAEPGVKSEFEQRVQPVTLSGGEQLAASSAVRGSKRRGRGVPVLTLRATLRGISSSRTACSRADLSTEWMYVSVSGESSLRQHWPAAQQRALSRPVSMPRAQHWHAVRSWLSQVRTSFAESLASFFLPRPGTRCWSTQAV